MSPRIKNEDVEWIEVAYNRFCGNVNGHLVCEHFLNSY